MSDSTFDTTARVLLKNVRVRSRKPSSYLDPILSGLPAAESPSPAELPSDTVLTPENFETFFLSRLFSWVKKNTLGTSSPAPASGPAQKPKYTYPEHFFLRVHSRLPSTSSSPHHALFRSLILRYITLYLLHPACFPSCGTERFRRSVRVPFTNTRSENSLQYCLLDLFILGDDRDSGLGSGGGPGAATRPRSRSGGPGSGAPAGLGPAAGLGLDLYPRTILTAADAWNLVEDLIKFWGESGDDDHEALRALIYPIIESLSLELMVRCDHLVDAEEDRLGMIYLTIWERLAKHPAVRKIVIAHPRWIPRGMVVPAKTTGKELEFESLIGPLFKASPLSRRVIEENFAMVDANSPPSSNAAAAAADGASLQSGLIQSVKNVIRERLGRQHKMIEKIIRLLLKPLETREAMLEWLAAAVNCNEGKGKTVESAFHVSSDGWCLNVASVILQLATFVKIPDKTHGMVNLHFGMLSDRISFRDETKVCTQLSTAHRWYSEAGDGDVPLTLEFAKRNHELITTMYFLAMKASHFGLLTAMHKTQQQGDNLDEHRQRFFGLRRVAQGEQVGRMFADVSRRARAHAATETIVYWPAVHERLFNLHRFTSILLLRNLGIGPDRSEADGVEATMLPDPVPKAFAALPEFFVTDMVQHFTGCVRERLVPILRKAKHSEFAELLVLILCNKRYLLNPQERAKIPEVFVSLCPTVPLKELNQILLRSPAARRGLMRALVELYVDVEHMENSYYVKHKPRFEISHLLRIFWTHAGFKQSLEEVAESDRLVLFFLNMNINDATALFDECIETLRKIMEFERIKNDPLQWQRLGMRDHQQMDQQNHRNRFIVQTRMQLTNATMDLLGLLTKEVTGPYVRPEIVERVAVMLNHFLSCLTDPTKNFVVSDIQQLNYDPIALMARITGVYVNLSEHCNFVHAVAADQRSFRPEMFVTAFHVLAQIQVVSPDILDNFNLFSARAKSFRDKMDAEVEEIGEYPHEFIDQLTYDPMSDPVKLPSSGAVVDRSTIDRHLLSYNVDPFTRAPLEIGDVIPLPELKFRIGDFLHEKRTRRDEDTMDCDHCQTCPSCSVHIPVPPSPLPSSETPHIFGGGGDDGN